jgi:hypothetical protein
MGKTAVSETTRATDSEATTRKELLKNVWWIKR